MTVCGCVCACVLSFLSLEGGVSMNEYMTFLQFSIPRFQGLGVGVGLGAPGRPDEWVPGNPASSGDLTSVFFLSQAKFASTHSL